MFDKLNQLKEKLNAQRPLPPGLIQNLREVFRIEWIYHSNAIEGNTLNLLETKMVVEEDIAIGGKRLTEHFEAINHAKAIDFVEELVIKKEAFTEGVLKKIHSIVLQNIDDENAGKYRMFNVRIAKIPENVHIPPHFLDVPQQMKDLFTWYKKNQNSLHPVELASRFHFQLVYIHPFADGNGRTARLSMNLILMKHGYPPAIIKANPEHRFRYYEALEKASVEGNIKPFVSLVTECVEESLSRYLQSLGIAE
jgi:Fic family protein